MWNLRKRKRMAVARAPGLDALGNASQRVYTFILIERVYSINLF